MRKLNWKRSHFRPTEVEYCCVSCKQLQFQMREQRYCGGYGRDVIIVFHTLWQPAGMPRRMDCADPQTCWLAEVWRLLPCPDVQL